jgi:hypothetical protein
MELLMRFHKRWSVLLVILIISAGMLLPGCSKFKSHKRMDLTPFAENMIEMAADIQYGLAQEEVIYLRKYMGLPENGELNVYLSKIRTVMRGSIAYSIEVVTLSSSTLTGPEQCVALADYLDDLLRPVLEAPAPPLHFTGADLDTILIETKQQTKLLDALGKTQPIVNEIARSMSEILDDANLAVNQANRTIGAAIEKDNEILLEGMRLIRNHQMNAIISVEYIAKYRRGNPEAFDTLLQMQPSLKEVVSSTSDPTREDLIAVEQRLIFLMKTMSDIRSHMTPDLELYWKQQAELEDLTKAYKSALRKAQVAMIAWSRAHQRLAAGITDPAKIDVLGLAKKAAKAAGPL